MGPVLPRRAVRGEFTGLTDGRRRRGPDNATARPAAACEHYGAHGAHALLYLVAWALELIPHVLNRGGELIADAAPRMSSASRLPQ